MSLTDDIRKVRVLDALREKLKLAKVASVNASQTESSRKEVHADAVKDLAEIDGKNGNGVRFDYYGTELAAFVCQPEPELIWDAAPLIEYLQKVGLYDKVSTVVLDPEKLESEMAAGNIKRATLKKFQIEKPRSPYLKFINPRPESK